MLAVQPFRASFQAECPEDQSLLAVTQQVTIPFKKRLWVKAMVVSAH